VCGLREISANFFSTKNIFNKNKKLFFVCEEMAEKTPVPQTPKKREREEDLEPFEQVEQWFALKSKKKKLKRELETVERAIKSLERTFPLVGNVKGMIKKQESKRVPEEGPEEKKQKTEVPVDEKEKKLKELEKKERKAAEKTELDKLREKDNPSFQTGLSKKDKEVMKTRAKSPRKAPAPIVEKDFMEEK